MQMKKICFIQYNLGAPSETFLTRHLELLKDNFEVFCITGNIADKRILKNSNVFDYTILSKYHSFLERIKAKIRGENFIYGKSIIDNVKKINPDLVVFQFAFLPVLMERELKNLKIPFVVIHHGTDLNRARVDLHYKMILKKVWKKAHAVIFISDFLFNEGIQLGIEEENAFVIPLGVQIKPNIFKDTVNEFKILSVGRLTAVKNHNFLIKGFKVFNDLYPESQLTIVGGGELEEHLTTLIKKLRLEEKVNLTGALSYDIVEQKMGECNVFCLMSKKVEINNSLQEEGLGISLLEASSFNKPLIGTKSGGIPEVIEHGVNGFLVEPDDVNGLVNSLEKLYKNPLLRKEIGENARLKAVKEFDQKIQIQEFTKVYTDICDNI